ncbi:MAG: hypothetical protein R3F65_21895 [bacterium]
MQRAGEAAAQYGAAPAGAAGEVLRARLFEQAPVLLGVVCAMPVEARAAGVDDVGLGGVIEAWGGGAAAVARVLGVLDAGAAALGVERVPLVPWETKASEAKNALAAELKPFLLPAELVEVLGAGSRIVRWSRRRFGRGRRWWCGGSRRCEGATRGGDGGGLEVDPAAGVAVADDDVDFDLVDGGVVGEDEGGLALLVEGGAGLELPGGGEPGEDGALADGVAVDVDVGLEGAVVDEGAEGDFAAAGGGADDFERGDVGVLVGGLARVEADAHGADGGDLFAGGRR